MEATVVNFRRGRKHQHIKQMVVKIGDTTEEAQKAVGKTVSWTSPSGKVIVGQITGLHGRTGSVRTQFLEKGLPGQAIGQKVKVQ